VGLVVDKVALEQVSSEYFGSTANFYSTNCSTFIIIHYPGLGQRVADVPSGLIFTPPPENKKKVGNKNLLNDDRSVSSPASCPRGPRLIFRPGYWMATEMSWFSSLPSGKYGVILANFKLGSDRFLHIH
jgi:hypothetical protein